MKKLILTLSLVVFLFSFVGCEEAPVEPQNKGGDEVLGGEERTSIWKCVITNNNSLIPIIITLTIDFTTNVVSTSTSKSLEEEERPVWYIQFDNEIQYRLQGDSLYYLKAYEGLDTSTFYKTVPAFLITKLSEVEMRLDYNWGLPANPRYIGIYFFVRVKG